MTRQLISHVEKSSSKKVLDIPVGATIRVHQKIKEGEKERVQIFEGLVIKTNGRKGINEMITVRKVVEGIGVEKIFPMHSPNIVKVEVKKIANVRRAKLYYIRDLSGKAARLREKMVDLSIAIAPAEPEKAVVAETIEPVANETPAEEASNHEEAVKPE